MYYAHAIGGSLADGRNYYVHGAEKFFASPMKELNQKTVLMEEAKENNNDSYRQHTKYNDRSDSYYSTYDLGILLQNAESCLEGKIDSCRDVDYYAFSYQQKKLYSRMGISSEVTLILESQNENCNLIVYDSYGNQVGMAVDDGNGNKKLTLPDWDCVTSQYFIRVETAEHASGSGEQSYRIKITETKSSDMQSNGVQHALEIQHADGSENKNAVMQKQEALYKSQLDKLHKMQYEALPENEKYAGTSNVEELLERMRNGEPLNRKELAYIKIFANLADYEKAEAMNYIHNKLYQDIKEMAEQNGVQLPSGTWSIEIDMEGNLSVQGDMKEKNKKKLENMLSENFSGDLWKRHMQTVEISNAQYKLLDGYYEVDQFIRKATNGKYSYKDIVIDNNGKIGGLPNKMCKSLNSQEANARYEEIRDNIYMLKDYENTYGLKNIINFSLKYQVSDSRLDITEPTIKMEWIRGVGYYKNMKAIR